jgi:predicted phage tail protein
MTFEMSGNLLRFCNFRRHIEVGGATVEEGLGELLEQCPTLRTILLDGEGQVRRVHRFYHNGDLITREELARPSGASDEITILTAIAGG